MVLKVVIWFRLLSNKGFRLLMLYDLNYLNASKLAKNLLNEVIKVFYCIIMFLREKLWLEYVCFRLFLLLFIEQLV